MEKTAESSRRQWLVVIGCMLMQAIPFGVASNIQPQFISYVVEGEGFSLAAFSLIFTIGTLISAIASPGIGYIYNRVNPKIMYLIGSILACGGFMLFSYAHALWQFYLIAAISQVGVAVISSIGVPILINAWFGEDMRGKAMGIAFAGGSIGNIFLQTLAATALARQGYGWSYLMFGILGLVVGIPVALTIIRYPREHEKSAAPAQKGSKPKKQQAAEEWGYTLSEVRQEKYFWLLLVAFVFLGIYISALAVQYPAYLKGYLHLNPTIVGLVGSTFALFSLFGNVGGGALFDKLGPVRGMAVAGVLAAVSCIALLVTPMLPQMAFVFAACKGLSVFSYMLGPAFLTGSLFGRREFGAILGLINLGFAVGFASGSTLFGLLVDFGSYTLAWSLMLVCIVIGYILVLWVAKRLLERREARQSGRA